jgi:hypothetical protein
MMETPVPDSNTLNSAHEALPWLLTAGAGVALGVTALLVWLLVRASRHRDPLSRETPTLSLSQQRAVERDISALMNDLAEMAREVGKELDRRSARLEQLIREADKRLERFSENSVASTPAPPAGEPIDPRHVEIYTLADQGVAMQEIAQRLKRPNGEVELILALRPRKRSTGV